MGEVSPTKVWDDLEEPCLQVLLIVAPAQHHLLGVAAVHDISMSCRIPMSLLRHSRKGSRARTAVCSKIQCWCAQALLNIALLQHSMRSSMRTSAHLLPGYLPLHFGLN